MIIPIMLNWKFQVKQNFIDHVILLSQYIAFFSSDLLPYISNLLGENEASLCALV